MSMKHQFMGAVAKYKNMNAARPRHTNVTQQCIIGGSDSLLVNSPPCYNSRRSHGCSHNESFFVTTGFKNESFQNA